MAKTKYCFHCEPCAARLPWHNPHQPCGPCRAVLEASAAAEAAPDFDPGLVRSRLRSALNREATGLERHTYLDGLLDLVDIRMAITSAAHALDPLEIRVLRMRLVQGRSQAKTAASAGCTADDVAAAEKSAVLKLVLWLGGVRDVHALQAAVEAEGEAAGE